MKKSLTFFFVVYIIQILRIFFPEMVRIHPVSVESFLTGVTFIWAPFISTTILGQKLLRFKDPKDLHPGFLIYGVLFYLGGGVLPIVLAKEFGLRSLDNVLLMGFLGQTFVLLSHFGYFAIAGWIGLCNRRCNEEKVVKKEKEKEVGETAELTGRFMGH